MGQALGQCYAGLSSRDAGERAKMCHILTDRQQHGFFADGLFIGTSCQKAVSALLILADQRQIENRSREYWPYMDGLIRTNLMGDDPGLDAELGLCVVS